MIFERTLLKGTFQSLIHLIGEGWLTLLPFHVTLKSQFDSEMVENIHPKECFALKEGGLNLPYLSTDRVEDRLGRPLSVPFFFGEFSVIFS